MKKFNVDAIYIMFAIFSGCLFIYFIVNWLSGGRVAYGSSDIGIGKVAVLFVTGMIILIISRLVYKAFTKDEK